jgi:DNA-directed RNA polymerase subunit M/transcription elongation factor TFIIS
MEVPLINTTRQQGAKEWQFRIKTCPRCNGRLLIKRETHGWYEECVLCGERKDISELVTVNTVGQIKILDRTEIEQKPDIENKLAQANQRHVS